MRRGSRSSRGAITRSTCLLRVAVKERQEVAFEIERGELAGAEVGRRDPVSRDGVKDVFVFELGVEAIDVVDLDAATMCSGQEGLGARADRSLGEVRARAPFLVGR